MNLPDVVSPMLNCRMKVSVAVKRVTYRYSIFIHIDRSQAYASHGSSWHRVISAVQRRRFIASAKQQSSLTAAGTAPYRVNIIDPLYTSVLPRVGLRNADALCIIAKDCKLSLL